MKHKRRNSAADSFLGLGTDSVDFDISGVLIVVGGVAVVVILVVVVSVVDRGSGAKPDDV